MKTSAKCCDAQLKETRESRQTRKAPEVEKLEVHGSRPDVPHTTTGKHPENFLFGLPAWALSVAKIRDIKSLTD